MINRFALVLPLIGTVAAGNYSMFVPTTMVNSPKDDIVSYFELYSVHWLTKDVMGCANMVDEFSERNRKFWPVNKNKFEDRDKWNEVRYVSIKVRTHYVGWLGSWVVSVLDSGWVGPRFKSQPWRCRVTVLGKLFTPIVPLFAKQRNW